ncbi:ankyrin repeat domain-containing protein 29 [Trichonephila inaurata madagascariensis]|uniref:Ankyrin repeat domain-containing protein 29 n=1 Tax=Trichonephila inaurata madagascariensis TaxID=2747483 RepID=A0A8X6MGM6_9ARAC|nr:ankyrin repeat domain-containing protein 29 [Trichonephila inaurata madagascariensis]
MFKCNDSVPKTFMFDTTFQGLAGYSYTYFNKDETSKPSAEILHRAALKGDVELLRRTLDAGIPVDSRDKEGTTALILACRYNHYDCAKLLLERGADPLAQRLTGSGSSLCYAARGGYLRLVQLLLSYGVNIEACGVDGATPFLLACQCNHLEIAQETLAANPEYEKRIIGCTTPMYVAAQNGHAPIVRFLLSRGADINMQRRIPPKSPDELPSTNGTTPLFVACQYGHTSLVKNMVEWGADVNITRDDGCSPLLKAAHKGYTNIVKFLLCKGAHYGLMKNGESPLHAAAYFGHLTVLKALIEHGADINLKDKNGLTALEKAEEGGHQIAVRYLARIRDQMNSMGHAPLHF